MVTQDDDLINEGALDHSCLSFFWMSSSLEECSDSLGMKMRAGEAVFREGVFFGLSFLTWSWEGSGENEWMG